MDPVKFDSHDVEAVFSSYPEKTRAKLMRLRKLIAETAAKIPGVGPVEETLKWGQPAYTTPETKSGSTFRIDRIKPEKGADDSGEYAMYFHCQSNLISSFRRKYPEEFNYDGNRAIVFGAKDKIPVKALKDCIELALTYHLRKKKKK